MVIEAGKSTRTPLCLCCRVCHFYRCVSLPLCLFASASLCLCVCLPLCLSASVSVCLCVCLPMCRWADGPMCSRFVSFAFVSLPLPLRLPAPLPLCLYRFALLSLFNGLRSGLPSCPGHVLRKGILAPWSCPHKGCPAALVVSSHRVSWRHAANTLIRAIDCVLYFPQCLAFSQRFSKSSGSCSSTWSSWQCKVSSSSACTSYLENVPVCLWGFILCGACVVYFWISSPRSSQTVSRCARCHTRTCASAEISRLHGRMGTVSVAVDVAVGCECACRHACMLLSMGCATSNVCLMCTLPQPRCRNHTIGLLLPWLSANRIGVKCN